MSAPRRKTLGNSESLPMPPAKRRKSLATPRDSLASEASQSTPRITPHATLRQLAGLNRNPSTPARKATNAPSLPTLPSAKRGVRPLGESNNAANTSRPLPPPNTKPATPHGIRALQRRNAALTPGRDRRRSGRIQRETPVNILRNLSRALAPTSRQIESSPQVAPEPQQAEDDGLDQEPDLPKPRFSLPLERVDEDDDDSLLDAAPILSMPLDQDNYTSKSVELPRRAISEQPLSHFTRGSFGSIRLSDIGDISRFSALSEGDVGDSVLQPRLGGPDDHDLQEDGETTMHFDRGGDTEDLRKHNLRWSLSDFPSVHSDPLPGNGGDDETFVLDGIDAPGLKSPSPLPDVPPVASEDDEPEDELDLDGVGEEEEEMEDVTDDEDIATGIPVEQPTSTLPNVTKKPPRVKARREQKFSKHGIAVPSLPSGIVKKIATQFSRSTGRGKAKIGKDSLQALENATEWFFEQVGEDLGAYAAHAGRRTIDESDVVQLMRRQRHASKNTTVFALAQRYLPKELLQDVRVASLS